MQTCRRLRRSTSPPAIVWLVCAAVGALGLTASTAAQQPAAGGKEKGQKKRQMQVSEEGLLRNIWWNQDEVITKLSLKPEQCARMDEHFKAFRGGRMTGQSAIAESRKAFLAALKQGDFAAARRTARPRARR